MNTWKFSIGYISQLILLLNLTNLNCFIHSYLFWLLKNWLQNSLIPFIHMKQKNRRSLITNMPPVLENWLEIA